MGKIEPNLRLALTSLKLVLQFLVISIHWHCIEQYSILLKTIIIITIWCDFWNLTT